MVRFYSRLLIGLLTLFVYSAGSAQSLLDKPVSITAKKRQVKEALDIIGKRCGFSFSYSSTLVPGDSLVSIAVVSKPVKQVLQLMLGDAYQYKEVDNHIVILPAEKEKWFTISGQVTDAITGLPVADVSVFERQQLSSTLTNADGYYRLHIKDKGRYALAEIVFSRGSFYIDTSASTSSGYDHEISITLAPNNYTLPDALITQYSGVERSWLGKFLFSSQLRKQSANLGRFFVDKPVQISFVPGIGTHGKMSGQVTNKFSFNVVGGYAAGVNGFELGGIFNINKKDVRYAQVGGVFNIVSGGVTGLQIAGIINKISGSVNGVQVGGAVNRVGGSVTGLQISGIVSQADSDIKGMVIAGAGSRGGGRMRGMQLSGIINLLDKADTTADSAFTDTTCTMYGMQLAGVVNVVNGDSKGMQMAGIANITRRTMQGLQISAICNIAKRMNGTQIGLINIADTVTGYNIGLINIVKKGYHTLAVSTTELMNINLTYKTGNKKLYSILAISANIVPDKKAYAYGLGIGTERPVSRKTGIAIEFSVLSVYEGSIDNDVLTGKLEASFNWNISRRFSLYTGPSVCFMPRASSSNETGYQHGIPASALYDFKTPGHTATWAGWQVGFHIF